jgi:hypothetical protein
LTRSEGNMGRQTRDSDFERQFNDSCRRFSEMTLKYERKSEKQKRSIAQLQQQVAESAEHIDFLLDQIEQLKKETGSDVGM